MPVRCIKGEPAIEEYFEMASEAETHRQHILEAVLQSHTAQQFLSPGRVVVVKSQSVSVFIWLYYDAVIFDGQRIGFFNILNML